MARNVGGVSPVDDLGVERDRHKQPVQGAIVWYFNMSNALPDLPLNSPCNSPNHTRRWQDMGRRLGNRVRVK